MQKTTLEQWRMFKAVADEGGFSQAAVITHKSSSSVHHAVSKLEDSLGLKLLAVEGRKTHLTEAGKIMLRRVNYLLDEVDRIESVAKTISTGVETELRIAVDGAFPQRQVFDALEKVSALYPQINIDIIDTVLSGTNELITQGKADIGLSPYPMQECLNEEICLIDFVAVAHWEHPLNQQAGELTIQNLKSHRQIVISDSATSNKTSHGWLGSDQRWTVSHVRAAIQLVKQNFGYAWLPLPEISTLLERGEIKRLPVSEGGSRSVSFYLNYRDIDRIGLAAREFMGELRLLTLDMPTSDSPDNL